MSKSPHTDGRKGQVRIECRLTPNQFTWLRGLALTEGSSIASMVRRGVSLLIQQEIQRREKGMAARR